MLRKSADRGHIDHGWLSAKHTFSFGRYVDRAHTGFGPLRVINEDVVAPGMGFATHPHDNMEIITYVLEGALRHDDSTGGGGVLEHHDVQLMSAGSGLTHSEKNASTAEPLRLVQIWIEPASRDTEPRYTDHRFDPLGAKNALQTIASPDGRDGSLTINQDATLSRAILDAGQSVTLTLTTDRGLWVQVVNGNGHLDTHEISTGDGVSTRNEGEYRVTAGKGGIELLVFDLP